MCNSNVSARVVRCDFLLHGVILKVQSTLKIVKRLHKRTLDLETKIVKLLSIDCRLHNLTSHIRNTQPLDPLTVWIIFISEFPKSSTMSHKLTDQIMAPIRLN